ncbi:MAG: hypothetical protein E7Z65_06330 [Thermoplasmata archaeon]|nr:hypothetical protein [Thermoplasmata archaeon]
MKKPIEERLRRQLRKERVYLALKLRGPSTASALSTWLDGEETPHGIANFLAELKAEGKTEVVSSKNDVKTWRARA